MTELKQRVLKFRAWSSELKRFCKDHEWVVDHEDGIINGYFDADIHGHKLELSQFTGLLDSKGKEIYESDIVKAKSDGYTHIGEIRWILSGCPMIIIYPAFADQGFWGQAIKTWDIEIDACDIWAIGLPGTQIKYTDEEQEAAIAKNDGLEQQDLYDWFHPAKKPFIGQIICWNEHIEY